MSSEDTNLDTAVSALALLHVDSDTDPERAEQLARRLRGEEVLRGWLDPPLLDDLARLDDRSFSVFIDAVRDEASRIWDQDSSSSE